MTPTRVPPGDIAGRLAELRERIAAASGDPSAVTVVAVTKGFGADAVRAALGAGMVDIGENYADELVAKAAAIGGDDPAPNWHFLGAIQRNKVARLAPLVACWQGLSRLEEGRAIAKRRPGARVLVQVDIAGIPGRGGCHPEGVPGLVSALRDEELEVAGLMAVGPPGPPEGSRAGFRSVAVLADRLDLPVRSMGMTEDLEVAVSEGSTMVRIGRALFGDRPPKD
ncbi:MAG TPA: YggS family pyridoxal phosphate enzyme [Acidimicrobiales bacterium]|nr:YggS family pyridoxal phosphate enzyme [Acidimicrobiales bacterium]